MPILSTYAVGGTFGWKSRSAVRWYSDTSTDRHTVIVHGDVAQSNEGNGLKVALFDGSSFLEYRGADFGFGIDDFTIEAFINPSEFGGGDTIITDSISSDGSSYFIAISEAGRLRAQVDTWTASVAPTTSDPVFKINKWHHVAVVRTGGSYTAYVDGISVFSFSSTNNLLNYNNAITVGGRFIYGQYFRGKMANVRIVKGAAIYTADFTAPFTAPTTLPTNISGTKLLLNFGASTVPVAVIEDDVFTDTYIDENLAVYPYHYTTHVTAHGNRFYLNGVPYTGTYAMTEYTINTDPYGIPIDYSTVSRDVFFSVGVEIPWYKIGYAPQGTTYTLNGAFNLRHEGNGVWYALHQTYGNLVVDNETAFDFGHDDFTIEFFTKPFSFANNVDGADISTGMDTSYAGGPRLRIAYAPNRTLALALNGEDVDNTYHTINTTPTYPMQFGVWHHVAAVREGNVFKLYVDGSLRGTFTLDISISNSLHKLIFGGNDAYLQYVNGGLSNIRVVKGSALYTGNTYTIPTSVLTEVTGTSLLLTFGATAVPTVGT